MQSQKKETFEFIPILLAGGVGSRLWPLSTPEHPKQFMKVDKSNHSLFQLSILRYVTLSIDFQVKNIMIICNTDHRFFVTDQIDELNLKGISFHIILEEVGRNTAPAITLASLYLQQKNLNFPLLISPTDHLIKNNNGFEKSFKKIREVFDNHAIYTFGIQSSLPNDQFGHIICDQDNNRKSIFTIKKFIEKPNIKKSKILLSKNKCLFNSGIFVFTPNLWLEVIRKYKIDLFNDCINATKSINFDGFFIRPDYEYFNKTEPISIDYAVMEKISTFKINSYVSPLQCDWQDLGSFNSISDFFVSDDDNNRYQGNFIQNNSTNNIVSSEEGLIALNNLANIVAIQSGKIIYISHNGADHKDLLAKINKEKYLNNFEDNFLYFNTKIYRPWGWYLTLSSGDDFKVKKIHVKSGRSLSLQKHKYRSEHWVVVKGIADIEINGKNFRLGANESCFIKKGDKHRLSNKTKLTLEIIEVQCGDKISENDIIRLKDDYGR
jgi:mannose-1-phosphate guanylyltransferase/mannose-6-phosphate isomerase